MRPDPDFSERQLVPYRLPDGEVVAVDRSAAKNAPEVDYQLRGGAIVKAVRVPPVWHDHTLDGDESCHGCVKCYRATGDTVCDKSCEHRFENYPDGWPEEE